LTVNIRFPALAPMTVAEKKESRDKYAINMSYISSLTCISIPD
jgi:hypothetical protein